MWKFWHRFVPCVYTNVGTFGMWLAVVRMGFLWIDRRNHVLSNVYSTFAVPCTEKHTTNPLKLMYLRWSQELPEWFWNHHLLQKSRTWLTNKQKTHVIVFLSTFMGFSTLTHTHTHTHKLWKTPSSPPEVFFHSEPLRPDPRPPTLRWAKCSAAPDPPPVALQHQQLQLLLRRPWPRWPWQRMSDKPWKKPKNGWFTGLKMAPPLGF